jgi:hypothetical protein
MTILDIPRRIKLGRVNQQIDAVTDYESWQLLAKKMIKSAALRPGNPRHAGAVALYDQILLQLDDGKAGVSKGKVQQPITTAV